MTPILTGLSILIVDDEEDAREMLQEALGVWGGDVHAVSSADRARCVLATQTPHVIVSDLGMPDEDGITFIRRLRGLSDVLKAHIPAVALSAFSSLGWKRRAITSGFDAYLITPAEPWILAQLLREMADTASLRS